jgi:hypothetical protein
MYVSVFGTTQQVFLYIKWFHWILSEFIGSNEQDLVRKQWIHDLVSKEGLMNCTHILS